MVRGYNQRVWDEHKRAIVARGSYAKFTQNEAMRERLLDTGEKVHMASPNLAFACIRLPPHVAHDGSPENVHTDGGQGATHDHTQP